MLTTRLIFARVQLVDCMFTRLPLTIAPTAMEQHFESRHQIWFHLPLASNSPT